MMPNKSLSTLCTLLMLFPLVASAQHAPRVRESFPGTHGSWHADAVQRGNSSDSGSLYSIAPELLGQSPADMDLTRQIRRAVLDDASLSPYAHNVMIIARNGRVTLKGPVRSMQERALVEEKAASVAGRDNVKNEVEVSPGRGR